MTQSIYGWRKEWSVGVRTDTRERMVASAGLLLRERGVAGTTVAGVLAHSGGPRGSVGFHFPGGRAELLTDALETAGARVTQGIRQAAARGQDPAPVFDGICGYYREQLVTSDFTAGCPVGAAMQEAHHDPDLGPVVARILTDWRHALGEVLIQAGHDQATAGDLATLCISALEGAIMTARVTRSTAAIDVVRARITPLLGA